MRTNRHTRLGSIALTLIAVFALAAAPAALAQQETPPPPAAPRPVAFPKPVEKTLPNGLRVIVVERHTIPLVSATLVVKSGGEVDPPQLSGLADMTAELLSKGTKTRTAPEIAEGMEALGSSLNTGAGWDSSSVSATVMAPNLMPAMEILADVVRNPAFKEEEIERYRGQLLDDLNVSLSQPGTLASYVAARIVFGETPYGHPLTGTPESVPRISRADVVKLHETYYRPDNAIFVVGGDIGTKAAFEMAEKLFGDWKRPATPLPKIPTAGRDLDKTVASRVVVVDMPDAGQAAVVLTRPGIARSDKDYFPGIVTNTVLGGGYSARLNQEIRIKRGLSYGARSGLATRRDVGPFIASTQTKNETGDEVAALLQEELGKLSSDTVPAEELTPRKATLMGGFARSLETTSGLVGQIADFALYGLPLDSADRYIASVEKISAADVKRFASSRLSTKGASIVIVGNSSAFLEDLKKQFPNVEVIPVADVDLNSATLRKAAAKAAGQ